LVAVVTARFNNIEMTNIYIQQAVICTGNRQT